jgi:hypothetical protein
MVLESCNKLLLEISNNAIETMIKNRYPKLQKFMDLSTKDLWYQPNSLGINENTPKMKVKDYLRLQLLSRFGITHGEGPSEFTKGIVRIALYDLNMFSHQEDKEGINNFSSIIKYLHDNKTQEFDENLNGLSYNDLFEKYNEIANTPNEENNDDNIQTYNSDYTIVPINSYAEARQYNKYCYPDDKWCVTYGACHYDAYTRGNRRFYFCFKKGFEDLKPEMGPNCPLDEYGLSMISILVDSRGEPDVVTTRWNHSNRGENHPNFRTVEQIESVLGVPFYKTFKPLPQKEEKNYFAIVEKQLQDPNIPLREIFNDIEEMGNFYRVRLNSRYNILTKNRELFSHIWFNDVNAVENTEYFYAGLYPSKQILIDKNANVIFPKWVYDFDAITDAPGFYIISYKDKNDKKRYYLCDSKFKMLSNGYDYIYPYVREGYLMVNNYEYGETFIDLNGKILTDMWFEDAWYFSNGRAMVSNGEGYNFLKTDGALLLPNYIQGANEFNHGRAIIKNNDHFEIIDINGQTIIEPQYNEIRDIGEGFYAIENDYNQETIIDKNGTHITSMWFNRIGVFSVNRDLPLYTIVEKEGHYNFIDANGKFLRGWFQFPDVNSIDYGYICCQTDGVIKLFDLNMKELNIKEVLKNNNLYLEDFVDEDTGDVLSLLRQRRN